MEYISWTKTIKNIRILKWYLFKDKRDKVQIIR